MTGKINRTSVLLLFILTLFSRYIFAQTANDHIFSPSAAARASIDFDAHGFVINGKKTFLVSAGVEYARIPRQLWVDRLLRLKRDGFNCIEIYTFWNFHEPQDGVFNFTGDRDLNAFLKAVKSLNMYAIVRVGPYYCAEWDMGGYPLWLRFKDNLSVREPNAVFEKYVDRFLDHIMPIVSDNQINRGGSVILVQLENEHPLGWGTIMPNDYFKHLQTKALALGLQVPYFFSGLHHGNDPARNVVSFDDAARLNPWLTTEFWSVWFTVYGSGQKEADTYERRTWKIIAHGGNGYNLYMAHGGTNFDYFNDNEDAASYDYGAAVGQTGDLRQMYYQLKHNAFFARSFESILTASTDGGAVNNNMVTDAALHVNTRKSEFGDIIFVDNPENGKPVQTKLTIDGNQLPADGDLTLAPGQMLPVVHNFQLTESVKLNWSVARVLGISKQGNTTTMVVYGGARSAGYLQLSATAPVKILAGNSAFKVNGNGVKLDIRFDENGPVCYTFQSKNQVVRIIAVDDKLAERTWFVDVSGKSYTIIGPEYIGAATMVNNHIQIETEHFWQQKSTYPTTWLFGDGAVKTVLKPTGDNPLHQESVPFAAAWQAKITTAPAAINYNDQAWLKSKEAPQMGADGDLTADAWYRTTINVQQPGLYVLKVKKGGDRATVFVDGVHTVSGNIHGAGLEMNLTAGQHILAVFTAHDGRDKLVNYIGPIKDIDPKGLADGVILQKGKSVFLTDWRSKPATESKTLPIDMDTAAVYKPGDNAFKGKPGYAWFQAKIMVDATNMPTELNFGGVSDNATVFVNGKEVPVKINQNAAFTVSLTGLLNAGSTNLITLHIQSRFRGRGISKPVEVVYNNKDNLILTGWSLKGGPGDRDENSGWKPITGAADFEGPVFFKNTFTVKSLHSKSRGMFRLNFEGLGHGSVWVNGHNLGRYPEKIPVKGLYIPENWLTAGINTIVIFDEDGKLPDKATIQAELMASRDVATLRF